MRRSSEACSVVVLALALAAGCSETAATNHITDSSRDNAAALEPIPEEHQRLAADGSPMAHQDGSYEDGSPTHHADGRPVDYRPSNILAQIDRLPQMYLRTGSHERVIFEGEQGNPAVDPKTGELCWIAQTCEHPDCPGDRTGKRPYIFCHEIGGWEIGENQRPQFSPPADRRSAREIERGLSIAQCPSCRRMTATVYILPETESRKETLKSELAHVRAERRRSS